MPSPEIEKVYAHLRDIKASTREKILAGDIAGFRAIIETYGAVVPETMKISGDVSPVDVEGVSCEWVTTPESDPDRRLLYIHGGAWMSGSAASYRPLTSRLASATGCSVLAVDYRLAPENPFPAGLEDCLMAYRWMLDNRPSGARNASNVFIAGDSAGGNLTFATLLSLRDAGDRMPDAAVPISAATDFTASGESCKTRVDVDPIIEAARVGSTGKGYFGDGDPKNPLLSPLFADLSGLPPLLIHVGDAETLLDDSTRIAAKAKEAGVDATLEVWPEMPHVFHVFAPYLPESTRAIAQIGEFIRSHTTASVR